MPAGTQKMQPGLPPETQALWKAIATAFPQLDSLGSWGDASHQARRSDHNRVTSSGKVGPHAIDCMTKDAVLQQRIVDWALLHRDEFGISLIVNRWRKRSVPSGWKPRVYLGRNGHTTHVHISNDREPARRIVKELLLLPDGRIVAWEGVVLDGARVVRHIHTPATVERFKQSGYVQRGFDGSVRIAGAVS